MSRPLLEATAARQAAALATCIGRSPKLDRKFSRRYFKAADRIVAVPWSIAVGGDFTYPGTTGPKPMGTTSSIATWNT